MLPISPSAETAQLAAGSTPSRPHSVVGVALAEQQQHGRGHVADDADDDAGDARARRGRWPRPRRRTAARRRVGTEMSTERPSSSDSAVLAVPEPMLASSRRASSWMSVKLVLTGGSFCWRGAVRSAASASQSTIRAIWPSARTAPPDSAACSADLGRQRAGDQLALADELGDRERDAGVVGADDHGVAGAGRGHAGEPRAAVDDRQHAVVHARACAAPATERTAWSARRTVRSIAVDRDRERAARRPRRAARR